MYSSVMSGTIFGIQGMLIQVEADLSDGLPGFHMVGYLSGEVRESSERIRTAIRNSGYDLPPKRVVINLSPADIRKSGAGFDLPIAIAMLISMGYIPEEYTREILFLGELGLNGAILPMNGVLAIVDEAVRNGCHIVVAAKENAKEAALIPGITVIGADRLESLVKLLQTDIRKDLSDQDMPAFSVENGLQEILSRQTVEESISDTVVSVRSSESEEQRTILSEHILILNSNEERDIESESMNAPEMDFKDFKGQPIVRRAMEIAASGMHNLLMTGPPGAGKTMAAKCLTGILPELTHEESMELTKIYSIRGLFDSSQGLLKNRPFRAPHHTITSTSLIGGGVFPVPGEITLAHHGVLFLDELPEFNKNVIEVLRQPLEDGHIVVNRLQASYDFPADVMLIAAMNPCPCGCYPDRSRCNCSVQQIRHYQGKISRAIMDRMDLMLTIRPAGYREILNTQKEENSESIRHRVRRLHRLQKERYQGYGYLFNSQLDMDGIHKFCQLDRESRDYMQSIFETQELSARGYHRLLKLARTIADMDGEDRIQIRHLSEAVAYRIVQSDGNRC